MLCRQRPFHPGRPRRAGSAASSCFSLVRKRADLWGDIPLRASRLADLRWSSQIVHRRANALRKPTRSELRHTARCLK